MKSLIGQPGVNVRSKNKRLLTERIGQKRINSPKHGPQRQNYFCGASEAVGLRRHLAAEPVHLALDELPIEPFAQHQVIGRPVLDHLAELHDDDPVEASHRR